jgi:4'-phosphopantetheinyl transferase
LDVYYGRVSSDPGVLSRLALLLDEEDRQRIARYRREQDRAVRTAATAALRIVLAERMECSPGSLRFGCGSAGKPYVDGGPAFNISHSGDRVLIGVAAEGRLGVDIEVLRHLSDLSSLARSVFSPDELESLLISAEGERLRAFYRGWTRKEAFLKAVGIGLSAPLQEFSVSLEAKSGNALLQAPGDQLQVPWHVEPLACAPDAEAAVAWDQEMGTVSVHPLPEFATIGIA